MPKPLTRLETLKGMRISKTEGILAVVWMAISLGAVPAGFALYLGASNKVIGMLGAVQAMAGLATLVSAPLSEHIRERRLLVARIAGGGRVLWLGLAAAAYFLPHGPALALLLLVTFISWAMVNAGAPAWNSWMSDMVPERIRGRYFAQRNIALGIASLLAAPLFGRYLDMVNAHAGPRVGFASLFTVAGLMGLGGMFLILRQPEPPRSMPKVAHHFDRDYYLAPLRDAPFRRFLRHFALWVFAQGVAGQFFNVYMLETLKYSFFQVQMVGSVATFMTLASMPAMGYLIDKYGNRPLYKIAYVVVSTIPLYWILTRPDRPWLTVGLLVFAQCQSGIIGAAFGLTQFNMLLGLSPKGQVGRYSAVWAAMVGIAGCVAPYLGGLLADATRGVHLDMAGWIIGPYKITFFVSMVLRLALIPLLRGISEPHSQEVRDVLGRVTSSEPLRTVRHLRRFRGAAEPAQRARSVQALGRLRARLAFEELVEALNDPVLAVRRQAALALGEMRDPRALEPLLAALDPAAGVRTQAAVSLGKLGLSGAVQPLIQALIADGGRDTAFTQAAAQALGQLHAPEATAPLLEIAEEPENPARAAAIQSLGMLGEESAAEPLTEMLRSDGNLEPQEVSALGETLAKLGEDSAVIPLLERMAEAPTPLLRRELVTHAATLIGGNDDLYAWLGLDEYAREAALAQMLKGHARTPRRAGRVSAALRAERALEALTENAPGRTTRHLLVSVHKSGAYARDAAHAALHWIMEQSRKRDLSLEETLVALYAYDVQIRRLGETDDVPLRPL